SSAHEALATDSDDPMSRDASSLVDEAVREVERVAGHDQRLESVLETLRSASLHLADAARELAAYAADLDQEGPGELTQANERLAALNGLFRVHGANSAAVVEYAGGAAKRLTELDGDDQRIDELTARLEQLGEQERALASRL